MRTLDRVKVRTTIAKNTKSSYGLTLVIGLPFPREVCARIQKVQLELEPCAPGAISWYSARQLHTTLYAPLRGRYREQPPLRRNDLPLNLEGFAKDLATFFSALDPFRLKLSGVHLSEDGMITVHEETLARQLATTLCKYSGLDHPKRSPGLVSVIGFLSDENRAGEIIDSAFQSALEPLSSVPIGQMLVEQVHLVHYANRTLNQIEGRLTFLLGRPNFFTSEQFLAALGIKSLARSVFDK